MPEWLQKYLLQVQPTGPPPVSGRPCSHGYILAVISLKNTVAVASFLKLTEFYMIHFTTVFYGEELPPATFKRVLNFVLLYLMSRKYQRRLDDVFFLFFHAASFEASRNSSAPKQTVC